jgi:5'-methylthioadenosine phosphorylase
MKLGIILGAGFEEKEFFDTFKEDEINTPFGKPSSPIITGKVHGINISVILRHGKKHELPPSHVNDRANIFALKYEGCKHIISISDMISLKDEIKKGDFLIPSQFIDFTKQRKLSFFEKFEFRPIHAQMSEPFSDFLRKKLEDSCKEMDLSFRKNATIITVEGPRFPTKAENRMFRQFGDSVDMSIAPEAILANEAEVEYACLGLIADCDSWASQEPVNYAEIRKTISTNTEKIKKILDKVAELFSEDRKKKDIKEMIKVIDFPKTGVAFRDVSPALGSAEGLKKIIDFLHRRYKNEKLDIVAGIGAGSFGIAGILAERLGAGFVMLQDPKELAKENTLEVKREEENKAVRYKQFISKDKKILLVGEVLATGETTLAACRFVESLGGKLHECAFIAELSEMRGRPRLEINNYAVYSIVDF